MSDPAHVLFPNDAPATSEQSTTPARPEQNASAADDVAARMFPNDVAQSDTAPKPDGSDKSTAEKLFPDDGKKFDEAPIADFFDGFALSATADGHIDRARSLQSAGEALIADAKEAGTDAGEFKAALDIVRERQGDLIAELTPEKMVADFTAGMAVMQEEFGPGYMNEIDAARAFIRDLDKIAPGTIASLERTGAGSDPRLIRAAVREARRRGY